MMYLFIFSPSKQSNLCSQSHCWQLFGSFQTFARTLRPQDGLDSQSQQENECVFKSSGDSLLHFIQCKVAVIMVLWEHATRREIKLNFFCAKTPKHQNLHLQHVGDPARRLLPGSLYAAAEKGCIAQIPVSCLLQCSGSSAAVRGRHGKAEGRWEA